MSTRRAHPPIELQTLVGRLVREALERRQTSSTGAVPAAAPSTAAAATAGEPEVHRLLDSVVSLQVLEGLPEGLSRVEIGARAVLTPAAADLLRQRRVRVLRGAADDGRLSDASAIRSAGTGSSSAARWIADVEHPQRAAAYVRQLGSRGIPAWGIELSPSSAEPTADAVGVLVAELPAIHVDYFARQRGLSAAGVGSFADVARIAAAMSPAVWVLDAQRLSISGRIAVAAECFRRSPAGRAAGSAPGSSNGPMPRGTR